MKNLFNLLLVSSFAVSCVNLTGPLIVGQSMTVKKKGGFLNLQTKNITIGPGTYNADLKVNSEKSFTLKLKLDRNDESEILIPIKSEKEFNLPSNGAIRISGTDISQPFDLNGTIDTSYSNSELTRSTEECPLTRNERRCEKVCAPVAGGSPRPSVNCEIVCGDVLITYYGRRNVEYHYRYTHRILDIELNDINSKTQLATFSARGTESDRINDYYGACLY